MWFRLILRHIYTNIVFERKADDIDVLKVNMSRIVSLAHVDYVNFHSLKTLLISLHTPNLTSKSDGHVFR